MTTRYKWDIQTETYVPHERILLAMGRKATRTAVYLVVGAVPQRTFRYVYRNSNLVKRVIWWAQSC